MPRVIVTDTTPVGLLSLRPGHPAGERCRSWIRAIQATGAEVAIPEIAIYETRRELLRIGSGTGLRLLRDLIPVLRFLPITTEAMELAAELWAMVRRAGMPTADRHALDGDCILAAQTLVATGPGEVAIIATSNVAHLARFSGVDARPWETIA